MNLVLFAPGELDSPLPRGDRRAIHLLDVLRRREGAAFDAGLINGPRGRGTLLAIGPDAITLSFAWGAEPPPPDPLTLIIGLPRPQTARDILRDATSLGVTAMHFVATEKSEPSYGRSRLWTSGEWRRHLVTGAEQAFDTRLPEITHGSSLADAIGRLPGGIARVALDNYESSTPLSRYDLGTLLPGHPERPTAVALAVGPERGWSGEERACLHSGGFVLAHLGGRVLRTETAVTAAVALLKAKRGLM